MTTTTSNVPLGPNHTQATPPRAWFGSRLNIRTGLRLGLLLVAIMFLLSASVRLSDFRADVHEPNIEASYHVLHTVDSINALPLSDSLLLPTVTLGNALDRGVAWGATMPTKKGVMVYTSFSPIGFDAPWLFFKVTGQQPSITGLVYFNGLLGLASALLLFALLYKTLTVTGYGGRTALFCGVVGTATLIFSREGLHSFGAVYWHQSLEQIWLLAQLLTLVSLLDKPTRAGFITLGVVSFLSAYTEWSGIVGNVLLAVVFYAMAKKDPIRFPLRTAKLFFWTTVAGVGLMCVHLFLALGISPTLHALAYRFLARSANASRADFDQLMMGYAHSFGLFLALAFVSVALLAFWPRREQRTDVPGFVLLAALLPLLENAVMLQHAVMYTYDRMKLATALALIIALVLARAIQFRARIPLALLLLAFVISAGQNIKSYNKQKATYAAWPALAAKDKSLRDQVAQAVNLDCAVLGTNARVRGYTNMLFGRDIAELQSPATFFAGPVPAASCGSVFLTQKYDPILEQTTFVTSSDFLDLPTLLSATVKKADGTIITLTP